VTIPNDVLNMLDQYVSPRQRSSFIVEAIKEHFERLTDLDVFEQTAGSWKEEDHPDLRTPEDIDRYIAEIRGTWKLEPDR
jgi:hypothetical protein